MDRPQKRQRIDESETYDSPRSLSTPISPPRKQRCTSSSRLRSPWQLTWIRDLPEDLNQDAVTLRDLLGDPLISECWEFNFLHDIDFLMNAFDPDTRHLVKVHIVHGFWKHEDSNRLVLAEQKANFSNVELHTAPMPEMFGTHHSKMMILFRHDNTAQVIIHTANMIAKDWTNMTNGVWKSPLLPLLPDGFKEPLDYASLTVGSGQRFKADLLRYLRAYDSRRTTCKSLSNQLKKYDFASIRAALVASVPGKHDVNDQSGPAWGWSGLKRYLRSVPCMDGDAEIVAQISSIATLGAKDIWLQKTLFDVLAAAKQRTLKRPRFKVVFPTADEIRQSLDGYKSGGSIHTKIQSAQQAQQLGYLRPIFHHWANDSLDGVVDGSPDLVANNGGRDRAAPHIKTYIRYNSMGSIDWGLLTSANISKQAWGDTAKPSGEMRLASWEIGVLVWPELFGDDISMVGSFKSDMPDEVTSDIDDPKPARIGLRIPYSTPLQRYGSTEVPWVASMAHAEPDRFGGVWLD